jgi:drug/metabolite transporter (DMT)-like permease
VNQNHYGLLAGLCATLLWSLKPIYVDALKDTFQPAEIFFCAGLVSVLASTLGFCFLRSDLAKIWRTESTKRTIQLCMVAGGLLSVWYIAFYKALSGTASAQATIISFTWPFFAILAMRLFAPHLQRKLKKREYPLLGIAFLGAAITATGGSGDTYLLVFALLAALGSGFYLPFLSLALEDVGNAVGSRIKASFIVVSLANLFSFVIATPVLLAGGIQVVPDVALNFSELAILSAIGIGTYILAELVWCWAICSTKSPTIASLPYFSPAISVCLLAMMTGANVPVSAVVGLCLILAGNLGLHFDLMPKKFPKQRSS